MNPAHVVSKNSSMSLTLGSLILIVLSITGLSLESWAGNSKSPTETPVNAEDFQWSYRHFPIRQGSTSDTESFFTLLAPRNKDYVLRARPRNANPTDSTAVILSEKMGESRTSSNRELMKKVLKFHFRNLDPAVEYQLEIYESTPQWGEKLVDTRLFRSLKTQSKELRFSTHSCMCDENIYEDVKKATWEATMKTDPQVLFLMGDQTYVDSFSYVERGTATSLDLWSRYFDSFSTNPLFLMTRLRPTHVTWDDHDTGIDNGNKDTSTLPEAKRVHLALYGADPIPGVVETVPGEIYHQVILGSQNFFLLDNRSFRNRDRQDLHGHFGEMQERWLFDRLSKTHRPTHLIAGGLWGSPQVFLPNGKLISESFYGDHPENYRLFMEKLFKTLKGPLALHSGDIHASQIVLHGPEFAGSSRGSPFAFNEFTSSPMHSVLFPSQPGELEQRPDAQRLFGTKNYSFLSFYSSVSEENSLTLDAKISAFKETPQGVIELPPVFFGNEFYRNDTRNSGRRKILHEGFKIFTSQGKKKVKVALFDVDDTLRIAPSKGITAAHGKDVAILPGVADGIAKLVSEGYLIALASNQGGIHSSHISFQEAEAALKYTLELIQKENPQAIFHYYDFSENDGKDYFSKPQPGMGQRLKMALAQKGLEMDLDQSMMVGDAQYSKDELDRENRVGTDFKNSDRLFAVALGIRSVHPRNLFHWSETEEAAIRNRDVPAFQRAGQCHRFFGAQ